MRLNETLQCDFSFLKETWTIKIGNHLVRRVFNFAKFWYKQIFVNFPYGGIIFYTKHFQPSSNLWMVPSNNEWHACSILFWLGLGFSLNCWFLWPNFLISQSWPTPVMWSFLEKDHMKACSPLHIICESYMYTKIGIPTSSYYLWHTLCDLMWDFSDQVVVVLP